MRAIRRARPFAAISYAGDALDWWHRVSDTLAAVAKRQRAEVAAWHRANPIDMVRVIRTMCSHEDNVCPPAGLIYVPQANQPVTVVCFDPKLRRERGLRSILARDVLVLPPTRSTKAGG